MRVVLTTIVALTFLVESRSAWAQATKEGAKAQATADETVDMGGVKYKKKTIYDFDDDVVEGDLMRPDGEFVAIKRQAQKSSLIKIREHFIPEMLKSADDI